MIKNIFALFMLVLLNVQVSASAIKSCSQMMKVNASFDNESSHQTMEHSQHNTSLSAGITIRNQQAPLDHNNHMSSQQTKFAQDSNTVDCCDDKCLCEMASCNYSSLAFNLSDSYLSNNLTQNRILFVVFAHQDQFLNYLFKPPILS